MKTVVSIQTRAHTRFKFLAERKESSITPLQAPFESTRDWSRFIHMINAVLLRRCIERPLYVLTCFPADEAQDSQALGQLVAIHVEYWHLSVGQSCEADEGM